MRNVAITARNRKGPVPARLFMIFARKSPVAVIFRRGPSKWVQLIKWKTKTDEFEPGQWFKPTVAKPHAKHRPRGLRVVPNPNACGEDDPIFPSVWSATAGS
jgi:hypothetical protein